MRSCRTSCLGHGRRGSPGMPAAQPSVLRAPLMHRRCCRRAPREPRAARPLHASPAWVRRWPGEAQLRGSSARLQMRGPLWPRRRPDGLARVLGVLHAPACGAPVAAAHARATRPPASGHAPPPDVARCRAAGRGVRHGCRVLPSALALCAGPTPRALPSVAAALAQRHLSRECGLRPRALMRGPQQVS